MIPGSEKEHVEKMQLLTNELGTSVMHFVNSSVKNSENTLFDLLLALYLKDVITAEEFRAIVE